MQAVGQWSRQVHVCEPSASTDMLACSRHPNALCQCCKGLRTLASVPIFLSSLSEVHTRSHTKFDWFQSSLADALRPHVKRRC